MPPSYPARRGGNDRYASYDDTGPTESSGCLHRLAELSDVKRSALMASVFMVLVGLMFLGMFSIVRELNTNRQALVEVYDDKVDKWKTTYRAEFEVIVSPRVYTNATDPTSKLDMATVSEADKAVVGFEQYVKEYPHLKYVSTGAALSAEWGELEEKEIRADVRIKFEGEGGVATELTLGSVAFAVIKRKSHNQKMCGFDKYAIWSSGHCLACYKLSSVCLQVEREAGTGRWGLHAAGVAAGSFGCSAKSEWEPYTLAPQLGSTYSATGQIDFSDLTVTMRSENDPYLYLETIKETSTLELEKGFFFWSGITLIITSSCLCVPFCAVMYCVVKVNYLDVEDDVVVDSFDYDLSEVTHTGLRGILGSLLRIVSFPTLRHHLRMIDGEDDEDHAHHHDDHEHRTGIHIDFYSPKSRPSANLAFSPDTADAAETPPGERWVPMSTYPTRDSTADIEAAHH